MERTYVANCSRTITTKNKKGPCVVIIIYAYSYCLQLNIKPIYSTITVQLCIFIMNAELLKSI